MQNLKNLVDATTLSELAIFRNDERDVSLFRLLDRTATLEGRVLYKRLLEEPCRELAEVKLRTKEVLYFQENLALLEPYQAVLKQAYFTRLIDDCRSTYIHQNTNLAEEVFLRLVQKTRSEAQLFFDELLRAVEGSRTLRESNKTLAEIAALVELFRHQGNRASKKRLNWFCFEKHQKRFHRILECLSLLDCWCSLALAHNELALTFPQWILDSPDGTWGFDNLRNLAVERAVPNSIHFSAVREQVFVTGPNMAGKTTFLKAVGQAVYLARCGFGVPAQSSVLPWISRLATAFEVSSSIAKKQSFFSAEVDRSIELIESCEVDGLSVLLIDELFKGTNLIDAQDCLRYFVELSCQKNVVSVTATHFATYLKNLAMEFPISNYNFEATTDGRELDFDYKIHKGISEQRLGLRIFKSRWDAHKGRNLT